MYLSSVRVQNYKCFQDSGFVPLDPHMNVIVGQNNVGKTALLEALSLRYSLKPHRRIDSPQSSTHGSSDVALSISVTMKDLANAGFLGTPLIALPATGTDNSPSHDSLRLFAKHIEKLKTVDLRICVEDGAHWVLTEPNTFGDYTPAGAEPGGWYFTDASWVLNPRPALPNITGNNVRKFPITNQPMVADVGAHVARKWRENVYYFSSLRQKAQPLPPTSKTELADDGRNLSEVLPNLSDNPSDFRAFKQLVSQVIPNITEVTTPMGEGAKEIRIWMHDPEQRRPDLAVPLSDAGAGVTQILGILYVLVTSKTPRTILIDEPQLYLHPGAQRVLLDILRRYPMHQFILATHSPTLISAAGTSAIHLVSHDGAKSAVRPFSGKNVENQRVCMAELGANIEDVYGSRAILWLEGKTEELCFPRILASIGEETGAVIMRGIVATGDLEGGRKGQGGRKATLALDIYKRLTSPDPILPVEFGFLLDREIRNEQQMQDLIRASGDRMGFIRRRMFENYLLDAEAIAVVLGDVLGENVPIERVQAELDEKLADDRYFRPLTRTNESSRVDIDGAMVLRELFVDLSNNKLEFDKVRDCPRLVNWILANRPEALAELATGIKARLDFMRQPQRA